MDEKTKKQALMKLLASVIDIERKYSGEKVGVQKDRREEVSNAVNTVCTELLER